MIILINQRIIQIFIQLHYYINQILSVSYTHLDVYKRQSPIIYGKKLERIPSNKKEQTKIIICTINILSLIHI